MSRDTTVTYTCDRCKRKEPETRQGFYPNGWVRVNVFDIERNTNIISNRELCKPCTNTLYSYLTPHAEAETEDA